MIRAVKNWPIAAAATMAIVMESSIVMRRSRMFSKVSLRIGQPPTRRPTDADHAHCGERLPKLEPDCPRGERYEDYPGRFGPVEAMAMIVTILMVIVMIVAVMIVLRSISLVQYDGGGWTRIRLFR